jgi:hypothetical protein
MVTRISPETYFAQKVEPKVKYVYVPSYQNTPYQTNQILQIYFGAALIIIGVLIGAALIYFSRR